MKSMLSLLMLFIGVTRDSGKSDGESVGAAAAREYEVEQEAAGEHRGEQRREDAHRERDGEAADRSGSELEQEEGRDQRRHVRVDDGAPRLAEASADRRLDRAPGLEL